MASAPDESDDVLDDSDDPVTFEELVDRVEVLEDKVATFENELRQLPLIGIVAVLVAFAVSRAC